MLPSFSSRVFMAASVCCGLFSLVNAHAQDVYSQPAVFPGNSAFSSWTSTYDPTTYGAIYFTYDDFQVTTNDTLTGVSWQGFVFDVNTLGPSTIPLNAFAVFVLSDNGGTPGSVLYSQAVGGNANQTAAGTGDFFGNGQTETIFNYAAPLDGTFVASANTPYWLSIVAIINYPAFWTWTEGAGSNSASYQSDFYDANSGSRPGDRAFTLQGTSVPEPGAVALLAGMGLSGVGFLARRRKNARQAA